MQTKKVLVDLKLILPEVQDIEERLEDEFFPNPIGTISLFSEIGWFVVDHLNAIERPQRIFDLIEDAMLNGDDELKNAIATGFIEALVSRSDTSENGWSEISGYLGSRSLEYANAWMKFSETGET